MEVCTGGARQNATRSHRRRTPDQLFTVTGTMFVLFWCVTISLSICWPVTTTNIALNAALIWSRYSREHAGRIRNVQKYKVSPTVKRCPLLTKLRGGRTDGESTSASTVLLSISLQWKPFLACVSGLLQFTANIQTQHVKAPRECLLHEYMNFKDIDNFLSRYNIFQQSQRVI